MPLGKLDIAVFVSSFVVSILVASLITRKLRNVALDRGWVLGPQTDRHVHTRPTPRLGGVAIYAAFLFSFFAVLAVARIFLPNSEFAPHAILPILIPATIILGLGLYDDIRGVKPRKKIFIQAIVGALLYWLGFSAVRIPIHLAGVDLSRPVALIATAFWVIVITNAFNLIDGLDGLSAGSALFSVLTLLVISLVVGNNQIAITSVVLGGAILGFLRYNFNPATIFLGDSGSLFLGFMLSALALAGAPTKSTTLIAVAIPVISFGLPLVETSISIVRRFISGKPIFAADREHIHHKLLELGWSQTRVVVLLYGVSAFFAVFSVLLLHRTNSMLVLVLFVLGTVIYLGIQKLNYKEFAEARHAAQRTLVGKRIMESNVAVRKAAERLSRARTFEEIGEILTQGFEGEGFDGYELTLEPTSQRALQSIKGMALRKIWPPSDSSLMLQTPLWAVAIPVHPNTRFASGQLAMRRKLNRGDLMLDVNVLVKELPKALSIACNNALSYAESELAKRPLAVPGPVPIPSSLVAAREFPKPEPRSLAQRSGA